MTRKTGSESSALIADDILAAKWNLRIMRVLVDGPARFSGIRADIPAVSANILAGRLRNLEEAGIVSRRMLPPPADCQVYELTELGKAARPVMREIDRWASLFPPKLTLWKTGSEADLEETEVHSRSSLGGAESLPVVIRRANALNERRLGPSSPV